MENFIFSINVTIPIFLVMALGWGLKQTGMLNDNFVAVANKFNFQVTLPEDQMGGTESPANTTRRNGRPCS